MEDLTQEQKQWVKKQFNRWLSIRAEFQKKGGLSLLDFIEKYPQEQRAGAVLSQMRADIDHSALLDRLLSGKEPLVEPPPKEHAYPVYPD